MKNSKQKTFRHGSAVFTDKHCLYRIAVVRYVDSLFYESGDACRCHSRCYSLIVRELFGIGKNTFRHYLHYPSDRLTGVVIPRKLRELLRLYVILVKRLPATQVADCLHEFYAGRDSFRILRIGMGGCSYRRSTLQEGGRVVRSPVIR